MSDRYEGDELVKAVFCACSFGTPDESVTNRIVQSVQDIVDMERRQDSMLSALFELVEEIPKQDSFGDVCSLLRKRKEELGLN